MKFNFSISKKTPALEPYILQDDNFTFRYAAEILKKRWEEGEEVLINSPYYAYKYSKYVIGGRWEEAEPIISKYPESAFLYARDIIMGRFEICEKHIVKPFNLERGILVKNIEDIYISNRLLSNPYYPINYRNQNIFEFAFCYFKLLKKRDKAALPQFQKLLNKQILKYTKACSVNQYKHMTAVPPEIHNKMVALALCPHDSFEEQNIKYYFRD
jgi:hypothetical protein